MDKLEQLLNKYNQPYSLDEKNSSEVNRQKIRLEVMKFLPDVLEEMKELNALFAAQWERMGDATKLWQEEHNQPDIQPDLGKLLTWLLFKINTQKDVISGQSQELGSKSIQIETLLNTLKDVKDSLNMRITAYDALETIDRTLEDWGIKS